MSPGLCLDCVRENICSAITTLHKHYKLHNTHIRGVKCLSTESGRETNSERNNSLIVRLIMGISYCMCRAPIYVNAQLVFVHRYLYSASLCLVLSELSPSWGCSKSLYGSTAGLCLCMCVCMDAWLFVYRS